jgi:tetratricopeptide (TPR) repeat protein/transcriptional regulator with XRE-family HTH domain
VRGDGVAEQAALSFAALLRQLRAESRLTQEELAQAAGLSPRSVSDLERGINQTARKDTAMLLADALALADPVRGLFVAAARGRAPAAEVLTARDAASGASVATRTLPRDIAGFTGREPELRQLVGAVTGGAGTGGVVTIHAIGGMAGIGKTTLAVHAAHRLAPQFPDGQFFLALHAHTPGQRPVEPTDALASLLLTAGIGAQQIPPGLEARAALWRDHLAGKQLLLLLDDAAGHEQVRPLLPGTAGSLVLVTSRRHLTALEDAQAISLDILQPDEAAELLIRLAARPGLDPGDPAVAEITQLCGYLPLAVGLLASQLHHHPAWTPAGLAADLAAARDRLELMAAENLSVAAAFDLSYHDLTMSQKRLFRRLGLHPGTDIDVYAATALDDADLSETRRRLESLYDQHLITEPTRGRYRLHDLIREHARTVAAADPTTETEAATDRLLDYYLHAARAADRHLARQTGAVPATLTAPPAAIRDLPDRTSALAWARAERASLFACLDHVTGTGQHARVVALTAALAALLRQDGPWSDAGTRHTTAAHAARHLGDRLGEAGALSQLGIVRRMTADYTGATEAQDAALSIYRDLGDWLGEANTLNQLGIVRRMTGDYAGAGEALEAALGIHRTLGDRLGEANTLNELGCVRRVTGDFAGAAEALEAALGIYRALGNRLGEAHAHYQIGMGRRLTGNYPDATQMLGAALGIYRELANREGEAYTLAEMAAIRRLTGNYPGAAQALEAALSICRDLGDRGGEAEALNEMGTLHRVCGDAEQAQASHQQALDLARDIGSSWDEAHALAGLGRCALTTGRSTDAAAALRRAREILQRIGAAEASDVAAELDALEHFRLQSEVQAQLEQVPTSRARIVEADDAARRRLEHDLHDGDS